MSVLLIQILAFSFPIGSSEFWKREDPREFRNKNSEIISQGKSWEKRIDFQKLTKK